MYLSLSPLLFKNSVTDRSLSRYFFSIVSSHSWPRGKNDMQSEIVERGKVHLSEYNNSPTQKSCKGFSDIGGIPEWMMSYRIYLRKAVSGTASLALLWGILDNCDTGTLFIYRRVVSHHNKIISSKINFQTILLNSVIVPPEFYLTTKS